MDPREEMREILNEMKEAAERDVIRRTLSKLIRIEKEAMYGSKTSNKKNRIDLVINSEFSAYKESVDASSEN